MSSLEGKLITMSRPEINCLVAGTTQGLTDLGECLTLRIENGPNAMITPEIIIRDRRTIFVSAQRDETTTC